ncbi:MAG: VWA domain-containing protein, partial [Betaproteobacteria bacterium]|nr:VWA domain-containing protein [Betaproteobacteria bacterium]
AEEEVQFETTFSFSDRERLQRADFESMTAAEFALAKVLAERIPLPVSPVIRRRSELAPRGRINLRRTLHRMARQPDMLSPAFMQLQRELPPLVVLLDISGSMERYARLFLHYVHGLTRRHLRVQTFTFGTRLTNITRCLRSRDPDVAMQLADQQVDDWKGGTRIGTCLEEFNRHWARRVLGQNAAVLLVTDGLDRDGEGQLTLAAGHLHRMAHQIVWLNPLLRFDGFEPRAAGVRALLPHVDRFLPVHNLASLADLGRALRAPALRPALLLKH